MASFSEGRASLIRPSLEALATPLPNRESFEHAKPFQMPAIEAFSVTSPGCSETTNSLDGLLQERYQDGFKDGQKMAEQDADRARQQQCSRLGKSLSQRIDSLRVTFEQEFLQQEQSIAEGLIDLAQEIAARVIANHVNMDREAVLPVVRECLAMLPKPACSTQLKLHPEDIQLIQNRLSQELAQHEIELIADESIQVGGCQFSSTQFELVSTLQGRWRATLAAIGQNQSAST